MYLSLLRFAAGPWVDVPDSYQRGRPSTAEHREQSKKHQNTPQNKFPVHTELKHHFWLQNWAASLPSHHVVIAALLSPFLLILLDEHRFDVLLPPLNHTHSSLFLLLAMAEFTFLSPKLSEDFGFTPSPNARITNKVPNSPKPEPQYHPPIAKDFSFSLSNIWRSNNNVLKWVFDIPEVTREDPVGTSDALREKRCLVRTCTSSSNSIAHQT